MFPDHLSSILQGALLVAGSLWRMCLGFFFFFLKFENFPKKLENSIFCQIFTHLCFAFQSSHRESCWFSPQGFGGGGGWFPAKFDDRGSGSNQEISFRIPEDEEEEDSHLVCSEDFNCNYDSIVGLQMMKFFFRKFFIIIYFFKFYGNFWQSSWILCVSVCVCIDREKEMKKKNRKNCYQVNQSIKATNSRTDYK